MAGAGTKRVLVVDDDTAILRIIRDALQSFLHWEIDTSPNPEYAFELALKKEYDLMIFDFSMPMIDGTLLFHLISMVYENSHPARTVPPLPHDARQGPQTGENALLRPRRGREGAGCARVRGARSEWGAVNACGSAVRGRNAGGVTGVSSG